MVCSKLHRKVTAASSLEYYTLYCCFCQISRFITKSEKMAIVTEIILVPICLATCKFAS